MHDIYWNSRCARTFPSQNHTKTVKFDRGQRGSSIISMDLCSSFCFHIFHIQFTYTVQVTPSNHQWSSSCLSLSCCFRLCSFRSTSSCKFFPLENVFLINLLLFPLVVVFLSILHPYCGCAYYCVTNFFYLLVSAVVVSS